MVPNGARDALQKLMSLHSTDAGVPGISFWGGTGCGKSALINYILNGYTPRSEESFIQYLPSDVSLSESGVTTKPIFLKVTDELENLDEYSIDIVYYSNEEIRSLLKDWQSTLEKKVFKSKAFKRRKRNDEEYDIGKEFVTLINYYLDIYQSLGVDTGNLEKKILPDIYSMAELIELESIILSYKYLDLPQREDFINLSSNALELEDTILQYQASALVKKIVIKGRFSEKLVPPLVLADYPGSGDRHVVRESGFNISQSLSKILCLIPYAEDGRWANVTQNSMLKVCQEGDLRSLDNIQIMITKSDIWEKNHSDKSIDLIKKLQNSAIVEAVKEHVNELEENDYVQEQIFADKISELSSEEIVKFFRKVVPVPELTDEKIIALINANKEGEENDSSCIMENYEEREANIFVEELDNFVSNVKNTYNDQFKLPWISSWEKKTYRDNTLIEKNVVEIRNGYLFYEVKCLESIRNDVDTLKAMQIEEARRRVEEVKNKVIKKLGEEIQKEIELVESYDDVKLADKYKVGSNSHYKTLQRDLRTNYYRGLGLGVILSDNFYENLVKNVKGVYEKNGFETSHLSIFRSYLEEMTSNWNKLPSTSDLEVSGKGCKWKMISSFRDLLDKSDVREKLIDYLHNYEGHFCRQMELWGKNMLSLLSNDINLDEVMREIDEMIAQKIYLIETSQNIESGVGG
eukprot:TRINITY_DN3591_c0_g1_i1.p1 TRINITY_DN3591_c0_g1~~TRINITY_DN3591_c0_g1_i1.p1  ORF type:complete len:691 (-),score=154.20 TRINITY_DN3591_c0_g1_i1:42-2114(-)